MQHIASTFIAGLGCALFGWALVVISSRIERERQQRHADEFGEHMSPLTRSPPWIQFARSWLLPEAVAGRAPRGAARREFDVVMAWSVDRLGLIDFLSEIHAAGVDPS